MTNKPQFVAAYTSEFSRHTPPGVTAYSEQEIGNIVAELNLKSTRYDYTGRLDKGGDWIIERTKA